MLCLEDVVWVLCHNAVVVDGNESKSGLGTATCLFGIELNAVALLRLAAGVTTKPAWRRARGQGRLAAPARPGNTPDGWPGCRHRGGLKPEPHHPL